MTDQECRPSGTSADRENDSTRVCDLAIFTSVARSIDRPAMPAQAKGAWTGAKATCNDDFVFLATQSYDTDLSGSSITGGFKSPHLAGHIPASASTANSGGATCRDGSFFSQQRSVTLRTLVIMGLRARLILPLVQDYLALATCHHQHQRSGRSQAPLAMKTRLWTSTLHTSRKRLCSCPRSLLRSGLSSKLWSKMSKYRFP